MSGYIYPFRSSSAYSSPPTDDWSRTSYASDHVCRPVIIDAEGRKRPIVSFSPNQNSAYYVTGTETVVKEHVLSPFASEHKQTPFWSPDGHEIDEERWQKHPSPVHDRPPKVDEFITKVQTEASRPSFSPLSASTWRQTAKAAGHGSQFNDYSNNDWQKPSDNAYQNDSYDDYYGKYGSNNSSGWVRPSSTTWSAQPNSTTLCRPTNEISTPTGLFYKEPSNPSTASSGQSLRYADPVLIDTFDSREAAPMEPTMMTHGGWVRPSSATWASPPNSNLSKPTSDIPTAMEILLEAAKPSISTAPNSSYTEPGYRETIDSREAARRYRKFNFLSKPYTTENNYTRTIDSREAARKYNGTTV